MKKFLYLLMVLFCCSQALAASTVSDNLGEDLSFQTISKRLNNIEKKTKAEEPDIKSLVSEISYLNETALKLENSRKDIGNEIKLIEKRIDALGEVDSALPEAKIIAQKRQEFNAELTAEKTRLSEIDILSAKIEELNLRIFDIRNQKLWGNLLKAEDILVYPTVFWKANNELFAFCLDIIKSPFDWYNGLNAEQSKNVRNSFITIFLVITVISCLGYWVRCCIINYWGYRSDIDGPRLGRKILAAATVWCAYGIIPTAIIGFCLWWIIHSGVISGSFLELLLSSLLYYLLYIIIGRASFRVFLTPYNEKWRLINISTDKARRIIRVINLCIAATGLLAFMQHVVSVGNYSLELLSYLLAISSIIKAVFVVWAAYVWFASEETSEEEVLEEDDSEPENVSTTFRIGMFVSLFAMMIIIMSLFGYARLASFIINRSIITVIAIAVFSILRRVLYDAIQRILLMGLWINTFKMRRMFLRKIDFWFGIIAEPLLLIMLICALLLLWGVPFDVLQTTIYRAISGFMIGGIKISLLSIFWGIIAFVICLWIIRAIRNRIEFKLLEKTSIDTGTKHSLASGFAYIGYVLAGLLAIAIMGGNLSNIAIIAGALSVGIGLGLQDIVNNFVSGIIMLVERPIKVGDWVVINGEEGTIKQINIRSTELETFNRHSVIIPNSKVLSNSVTNLTHQSNLVRYSVKVGVAYGSDVELVKKVLLECAAAYPKIAKKPAPYVLFQNFGSSSLDFELRFYVNDIWNGWAAPSEVRYLINRRFIEEGVEIPFQQVVVHQGSRVTEQTEAQFYAKKRNSKNADK